MGHSTYEERYFFHKKTPDEGGLKKRSKTYV
jgi:hypothetical protein